MEAAISAAVDAFPGWSATPRAERQRHLLAIAAMIRDRREELASLLVEEIGKPITLARGEVDRTAITFQLAAELLNEPEWTPVSVAHDPRGQGVTAHYARFPVGPVLAIVPYNWPYNLAAHKIAPALAAGNTVVLKVSELAPLSGLSLARLMHEAGLPDGVVNAVLVDRPTAERAVQDPRLPILSFTGSPAVGWRLKELAPRKRVTLELGGHASALVFPDADLDRAVSQLIPGSFGYAGQICISVQHVRVHRDVFDEFRDRFLAAAEACQTGDPADDATVCGPLIDAAAADRVMSLLDEAEAGGGQILVGGQRMANVIYPAVVGSTPPDCRLATTEAFGPVVTLDRFEDLDDAVAAVNAAGGGIHCGVFTQDPASQSELTARLNVGGVVVNGSPSLRFDNLPYGGTGVSGFGREGVRFAFEEMTDLRTRVDLP